MEAGWQIIFGYAVCVYLIHYHVIALIVAFFTFTAATTIFYKYIIKYEIRFMVAKDRKMQLLKNVIKNIKYIKLKVWEIFYHAKLYLRREGELDALKRSNFFFGIVSLLNWLNPVTSIVLSMLSIIMLSGFSIF